MSTFRELAKSYRSNLKLTPNDTEPLELINAVATTRKITKQYQLDDRIFLDNAQSKTFLDFELKQLTGHETINERVPPKLVEISIRGEVKI